MHKKIALGISLTLVAVLGLFWATVPFAAANSQSRAGTITWDMVGEGVGIEWVDRGSTPMPGDMHMATNDLYRDGQLVGYDAVTCTTVRVSDEPYDSCYIGQSYADGILTAQVVKPRSQSKFLAAITGGTGAYNGARGQIEVEVVFHPDRPPTHYFTVRLERSNAGSAKPGR